MRERGVKLRNVWGIAALLLMLLPVGGSALPVADFSATRPEGGSETNVMLDAAASHDPEGAIISYRWLFGDGFASSGRQVQHEHAQAGTYTVTLLGREASRAQLATQTITLANLSTSATSAAPAVAAPVSTPPPNPNLPVGTRVGQRAPEFSMPTFGDEFVRLSDYLGQVVIFEFWRSTCPSCQASTPHLDTLREHFKDAGVVVILIVLDQTPADGLRYLTAAGFTEFVLVHEVNPNQREIAYTYGVAGVPQAFVVDRQGVIRFSGHPNGLSTGTITPLL